MTNVLRAIQSDPLPSPRRVHAGETVEFDALLRANLTRVFGERDPERRRAAMEELYTEDATLFEPDAAVTGREAISGAIDALQANMPADFVFAPLGPAIGHNGLARLRWRAGPPSGPAAVTGTDVAHVEGGRIRTLHVFLDPTPASQGREVQPFGTLRPAALALGEDVRAASVAALNQVLADTMGLRDLYKKHHWQVSGPTFHQLHLLFDKHQAEQSGLIDAVAERVQALGGVAIAISHDVAEITVLPRAPKGREATEDQLRRLIAAHQLVLAEAHDFARAAAERGDDGTNDLLVSQLIRMNEAQSWFVAEHLDGSAGVS